MSELNPWTVYSAGMILLGSILGAIGASSLYWFKRNHDKVLQDAQSPRGSNKKTRKAKSDPAKLELKERELKKDSYTLWGWCSVIVGSISALLAAFYPDATWAAAWQAFWP